MDNKGEFDLEVESEFVFDLGKSTTAVYKSLLPELESSHQRTSTHIKPQGNLLILNIISRDLVSARAALNGWLRLIRIAVEMTKAIES
ncbi:MAG: hypothetical protein K8R25_14240 [Methanosarcinales archaeon]|nr:hypothetical protein [Methanosarcinales archaeon]